MNRDVVELCAGGGGAALGLRAAGLRARMLVELDPHCCETLRGAGFDGVVEADVRDVPSWPMERGLFAMWASWPCQPWSSAGKGLGAKDPRNLWPVVIASVLRHQPRWFLGENVAGHLHHSKKLGCDRQGSHPNECKGCYFLAVVIPELQLVYKHVDWRVLNCADYGLPQTRKRLVVVAGPEPVEWPKPTHAEGQWVSMSDALGLDFDFELDGSRNTEANPKQEKPRASGLPSPTVGRKGNQYIRFVGGGANPRYPGGPREHRDLTDEPSPTIVAHHGGGAGNAGPWKMAFVDGVETWRRRLSPAECAVLQGFPEDHVFVTRTKRGAYRQVGNAVPPMLAELAGRMIIAAEEGA